MRGFVPPRAPTASAEQEKSITTECPGCKKPLAEVGVTMWAKRWTENTMSVSHGKIEYGPSETDPDDDSLPERFDCRRCYERLPYSNQREVEAALAASAVRHGIRDSRLTLTDED